MSIKHHSSKLLEFVFRVYRLKKQSKFETILHLMMASKDISMIFGTLGAAGLQAFRILKFFSTIKWKKCDINNWCT